MTSRRLKILCGAVVYSGMAIETLNPKPKILAARDALLPEDSFYLALEAAAQGRFGDDPGRYFKGRGLGAEVRKFFRGRRARDGPLFSRRAPVDGSRFWGGVVARML